MARSDAVAVADRGHSLATATRLNPVMRQTAAMYLEVHPEGPSLTPAQAKTLDDEFFRSDPGSHYSSRIAGLLRDADAAPTLSRAEQPAFFKALGIRTDELSVGKPEDRDMQVAVDALALRHQCAEALSRFVYAVSTATPRQGDAPCTWLAVSDSPTSTADVIKKSLASFKADDELWVRLVLPPEARGNARSRSAAYTALEWVEHAEYLLTDDELSVNVGHNKFKHGLAVSSRNDVRVELVTETPNENGEVPLSAFGEGKSLPLFDRPLFTFLSRPHGKPPRGIEAISLRVDVPTVLAEHLDDGEHLRGALPRRGAEALQPKRARKPHTVSDARDQPSAQGSGGRQASRFPGAGDRPG